MWLPTFLKNLRPASRRRVRNRIARCRLAVEALEARTVPSISFQPGGDYYTGGSSTQSVATGDFNHNGAIDLATVNEANSTVGVLLGRGDGSFANPITYAVGTDVVAVAAGDFNGDGNLDLAAVDYSTNLVWVLRGIGDGTFATPLSYAAGSAPVALVVADFNGDGHADVVLASQGNNTVGVLLNNGAGGFGAATSYAVASGPSAVAAGDFNGDGKPDLAATSTSSGSVSVLINTGGSFQPAIAYATGPNPFGVAVSDFNGDGKLDLVTAGSYGASVLLNNGNGTFGPAATGYASYSSNSMTVGDFNGDGKADVAMGFENVFYVYSYWDWWTDSYYDVYETDVGVSALEGNGDGTFSSETDVITNSYSSYYEFVDPVRALAVGDFNRDGFPDIAGIESNGFADVAINTSPQVELQLSVSPESATAGTAQSVTVSAFDLAGNPDPAYTGTVTFTSSDWQAVLPADYTFTAADHGVHTFSVTLKTAGDQSLTVEDYQSFASASAAATVTPAAASAIGIGGPYQPSSGATANMAVVVVDAYDNLATDYTGTVHFTSSDGAATLPADYTFTAADAGAHDFALVLRTAGQQTLTGTDRHDPTITGEGTTDVLPAANISGPAAGSVHQDLTFTLGGSGGASAGTVYSFDLDWNGDGIIDQTLSGVSGTTVTHSFASMGTATVVLTARLDGVTSAAATASVNIGPAAASTFTLTGPSGAVSSGQAFSVTVTACDPYGNVATGYTGTVHLSTSSAAATLPANYTFTAADGGVHNFSVILRTAGSQTVTATDTQAPSINGQTTVSILPVASISGPVFGSVNQALTFVLSASGGAAGSVYIFRLDWNGDGIVDQTVNGVSGTTVTHSFASVGMTTMSLTASINGLSSTPAHANVNILGVTMQIGADPADPTRQALFVTDVAGNDTIVLGPGAGTGVTVSYNSIALGTFTPSGSMPFAHLIVTGSSGANVIRLTGGLAVPAILLGGGGNDTLDAQNSIAANVLLGGTGNDTLSGGSGNDILIGGAGSDLLHGNAGDDILIGGTTNFDGNLAALCALQREWGRSDASYVTRVSHLQGGAGGFNSGYILTTATVFDDGVADTLYGDAGSDWFFARIMGNGPKKDLVQDRASGEVLTSL